MSGYRRAPNVSQYIANLNNANMELSPTSDFLQDDQGQFDFSTEFFDFDMGQTIHSLAGNDIGPLETDTTQSHGLASGNPQTQSKSDFLNADFTFTDFNFPPDLTSATAMSTAPFPNPNPFQANALKHSRPSTRHPSTTSTKAPERRSPDQPTEPQAVAAEAARLAAEEDKRRRNTAASARFRVKKKQREQALEKTAKEMTERAGLLEQRVQALEIENRWLKGLITGREDDEGGGEGVRASKEELEDMFRNFVDGLKEGKDEGDEDRGTKRVKLA